MERREESEHPLDHLRKIMAPIRKQAEGVTTPRRFHWFREYEPDSHGDYLVQVDTRHTWKRDRVKMLWDGFDWWWHGEDGPERFTHMVHAWWSNKDMVI